jgi:hypothetical protein
MSAYFVPTKFVWRYGGQQVCGPPISSLLPAACNACGLQTRANEYSCTCLEPLGSFKAASESATQTGVPAVQAVQSISAPTVPLGIPSRSCPLCRCPPQVHLCGSFTRWVETVTMTPVEGQPGVFAVIVHLPPGYANRQTMPALERLCESHAQALALCRVGRQTAARDPAARDERFGWRRLALLFMHCGR